MSQPGAKLTPDVTAYFSPLGWFSVRPTPRFERDLKDWRGVRLGIEVPLQRARVIWKGAREPRLICPRGEAFADAIIDADNH